MKKLFEIAVLLGFLFIGNQAYSQTVEIPNVITPNNDGINDFFYITSTGYVQMEGIILNRRGEPIINFYGINARWDGRNSAGERVMDGVYFYKITLTREDGEQDSFMGNIQVVGRN
ncbi:MAG: gliding motility-associated C-terminal domain-containing protein [Crocinitomicaceae bacterium]|nr:gliding motility-associated C-terminal domain-containing protein [Crocinitomicaceae bacterium]